MTHAVLGSLFHTPIQGEFEYIQDALITINGEGIITQVLQPSHTEYDNLVEHYKQNNQLTRLSQGEYLLPGMIDLHIHAPQWPQAGKGLDLPLDQWLMNYTFPLESRYAELGFAQTIYPNLIDTYLAHGTTTGVYFATIDVNASTYLAQTCLSKGQRAYIGRVAMDEVDMCPDYYVDASAQASVELTEQFIHAVNALPDNNHLVQPVVTPRFVPTCSLEAMAGLGELAQKYDCVVQTHASESDWARDFSREKYDMTDVEIYDRAGLLGKKSLLAHSIFLTDSDIETVKQRQSSLAHCPLSNIFFANAALPAREMLDNGVQVGLGSDIAASPYPSLFRCCFDAVTHSRARENGTDHSQTAEKRGVENARITLLESYWMATVGGARALDLNAGQISVGYVFDAIRVSTQQASHDLNIYADLDSKQDIFEKIIAYTDKNNITQVWVNGRTVREI